MCIRDRAEAVPCDRFRPRNRMAVAQGHCPFLSGYAGIIGTAGKDETAEKQYLAFYALFSIFLLGLLPLVFQLPHLAYPWKIVALMIPYICLLYTSRCV